MKADYRAQQPWPLMSLASEQLFISRAGLEFRKFSPVTFNSVSSFVHGTNQQAYYRADKDSSTRKQQEVLAGFKPTTDQQSKDCNPCMITTTPLRSAVRLNVSTLTASPFISSRQPRSPVHGIQFPVVIQTGTICLLSVIILPSLSDKLSITRHFSVNSDSLCVCTN